MPPPSRLRAASPPRPRKNDADGSSSSSSTNSRALESNQVVIWAVYCCIAVAVVALGAYTYGRPMLARAFADNTRSLPSSSSAAALEASSKMAAAKDAYEKAKEAFKATQGDVLSEDKMQLLRVSFYAALAVAAVVFGVGEATGNYSQVDKLWSLLPCFYTLFYTHYSGYNSRLLLQSFCTLVWGARLTYNFAAKGGYHWPRVWEGEEDYRWPVLRAKIPAFQNKQVWRLFHLLFIAVYQNILLWVITLPAIAAWSALPLTRYDLLAAAAMLFFVFVEAKADKQQNDFQARKRAAVARGDKSCAEVKVGFVTCDV